MGEKFHLPKDEIGFIQSNPISLPNEFRNINWVFYSYFNPRIMFNPLILKKIANVLELDLDLISLFGPNIYSDLEILKVDDIIPDWIVDT